MYEVVKLKHKLSFDLVLGVGRILKTLSRQYISSSSGTFTKIHIY